MTCTFCGGPWHPATGAWYGPRAMACYSCVKDLWDWLRARMKRRPRRGGPSFFDHTGRVDRPEENL